MKIRKLLPVLLVLPLAATVMVVCGDEGAAETEGPDTDEEVELLEAESDDTPNFEEIDEEEAAASVPDVAAEPEEDDDLYAGHHLWCEWPRNPRCGKEKVWDRETRRKKWKNYGKCGIDHRGVQLKCVRPYYDPERKICAPPFPKRNEQDWRRMRLRHIIGKSFDLGDGWWEKANSDHTAARAMRVYRYFKAVVVRETSMRPFKIHRLSADVEAAFASHRRHAKKGTYEGNSHFAGYRVLAGPGTRQGEFTFDEIVNPVDTYKEAAEIRDQIAEEHPDWQTTIQQNSNRWLSYGYTGQQSAGWVWEVDNQAPPEVLCLETFAVETYLRRMRRQVGKLNRSYDCKDAEGKPYKRSLLRTKLQTRDHVRDTFRPSTWHVIHRAASGGKICPRHSDTYSETRVGFERRAKIHGLKPHREVKRRDLGRNLSPVELLAVEDELDELYCETYESWLVKEETGSCG